MSAVPDMRDPMIGIRLGIRAAIEFKHFILLFLALQSTRTDISITGWRSLIERLVTSRHLLLPKCRGARDLVSRFSKRSFVLDGSVFPLQRFVQFVIVVQIPIRGFVMFPARLNSPHTYATR